MLFSEYVAAKCYLNLTLALCFITQIQFLFHYLYIYFIHIVNSDEGNILGLIIMNKTTNPVVKI